MTRHSLFSPWLLLLSIILVGCASPKYQQDSKSGAVLNDLHTYQWRSLDVEIAGANKAQIQQLLDEQLLRQGYRLATDKPDMLLDLQAFSRVSQGGNTGIGIGIGLPVGRHGSVGLGTSQILGRNKQEGVVVLDITRTDNNTLVWRGSAESLPLSYFELGKEQKLRDSLNKLLAQFPPQ
ncbi:DUF4136 domain-containing protein [Cellvibrio japonicus]|uniref:Putative lipoprotein n=1 Tax=Cellvibrio japonicus (strain Ueda107) TaxID=498211 RepID=B3PI57_CELJU|nr:DUF4136 domain-containing protein [Cellvibrio japonicus]ACE86173.1 putative lipoprotein [Cellvibrio japonicus Ueda107]QEI11105.1 DUF4136 domain-containing protein [Cellvibrio japonicus]QEI14679.1 DUF4136 domain-containing protein [Cellvibrio japonicus]QEI18259.1 DUF4136 domain-containing protein [Cellvibrio japonicus]